MSAFVWDMCSQVYLDSKFVLLPQVYLDGSICDATWDTSKRAQVIVECMQLPGYLKRVLVLIQCVKLPQIF